MSNSFGGQSNFGGPSFPGPSFTGPTVSSVQTANLAAFPTGAIVSVAGYYTADDNGGGSYYVDKSDTTTADNGGTCIVSADGVRCKMLTDGKVNVKRFGAMSAKSSGYGLYGLYQSSFNTIGTGDFTVWIRGINPSWTATSQALWELAGTDLVRAAQCTGSNTFLQFLIRSTTGGSTVTNGDGNSAAAFVSASNPLAALAVGATYDLVFTRTSNTLKVYLNGTDITSSFAFSASWSTPWTGNVGNANNANFSAGYVNGSSFAIQAPITNASLWNSVLSAGQVATIATVGGAMVAQVGSSSVLTDATNAINTAIAYIGSYGGGSVIFPAGKYRVDSTVYVSGGVMLIGDDGASAYISSNMPATALIGTSATAVVASNLTYASHGEVNLTPRTSTSGATITNRYLRSGISRMSVYAQGVGNCIDLQQISNFTLESVSLFPSKGYAVFAYACNGLRFENLWGSAQGGRGIVLFDTSDCVSVGGNFGGSYGPVIWLAGNSNNFTGGQFWNSQAPGSTFKFTYTYTGSSSNLTCTGHPFKTGDLVTVTTTNTVPTNLSLSTAYWVYVVDANTIRLNSNRDSAMFGTGITPTGGAGTQSIIPGPVANVCIGYNGTTINNTIVGCRLDQSYEGGVVLSGAKSNVISGCEIIDCWLTNNTVQNRPAVSLLNSSASNAFTGNYYFTDRSISAYVNDSIYVDASSASAGNFTEAGTLSRWGMMPGDTLVFGGSYINSAYRGVFHLEPFTVATRSRASNVSTIVTQRPHGLSTGQYVGVTSMSDATFNVNNVAVTVVDALTFTYANAGIDSGSTADVAGRVTPAKGFWFGSSISTSSRFIINCGILSSNRTITVQGNQVDATISSSGAAGILLLQSGAGAGGGVQIGSNGTTITRIRHATATLVGGTVTVADTNITASTLVIPAVIAAGGTQGTLRSSKVAGTSYTITSTSGTETSTVAVLLIEP